MQICDNLSVSAAPSQHPYPFCPFGTFPPDRGNAKLLNISDTQLSYITNVDAGHGLIKVGSSLVPFANKFPKNTKLYKLMTTKPGEGA